MPVTCMQNDHRCDDFVGKITNTGYKKILVAHCMMAKGPMSIAVSKKLLIRNERIINTKYIQRFKKMILIKLLSTQEN